MCERVCEDHDDGKVAVTTAMVNETSPSICVAVRANVSGREARETSASSIERRRPSPLHPVVDGAVANWNR